MYMVQHRLLGYSAQQLPLLRRGGEVQAAHPERRRHSLRLETAVQPDAGTGRGGQAKGVRHINVSIARTNNQLHCLAVHELHHLCSRKKNKKKQNVRFDKNIVTC